MPINLNRFNNVSYQRVHIPTSFPELYFSVYLVPENPVEGALFREMFTRAMCFGSDSVEHADLVVFGGGSDVAPSYYGQEPHSKTRSDPNRDAQDIDIYNICLEEGVPMLGICRGAQFLHVMNGGSLYQDVNNHFGDHDMYDPHSNLKIHRVSSSHHQAVIENDDMLVLGRGGVSTLRWENPTKCHITSQADVEAFYYRDTGCLGIQGHPEYRGYHEFAKWTLSRIEEFFCHNPDFHTINNVTRMKKDPK